MQCVILAAGVGSRLRPLTESKPKPLVAVCGKPLLDHIAESLPSAVREIILVIGYKGELIREYCGEKFHGKKVVYVEQKEATGTAHALWLTKNLIKGRFLFMFADDIHGPVDLARVSSYSRSLLVAASDTPERFGVIVRNPDGTLNAMIEKPKYPPSNFVSTGVMVLDKDIFSYEPQSPINGEYYLTEVIERYAADHPIAIVEQSRWIPIGYPEDIAKAEAVLCPEQAKALS